MIRCRVVKRSSRRTSPATTPISNCTPRSPIDATRVLVAAMEKADSVEPSDYLPALRAISYSGVTGQIAFDKEGNLKIAVVHGL